MFDNNKTEFPRIKIDWNASGKRYDIRVQWDGFSFNIHTCECDSYCVKSFVIVFLSMLLHYSVLFP